MTEDDRVIIEAALLSARVQRPYYARAIAALEPVANRNIPTIAVTKDWRLHFNPEFLAEQSLKHQGALIAAHEIEHLLRDHHGRSKRCGCEDWHRFNQAGDAEINDDVTTGELPDWGITPASLGMKDGLLAEQYYDGEWKQPRKADGCSGGSGAGGEPLPGEGDESTRLSPEECKILREFVARDVQEHIKQNGRGSVPGGVAIWADVEVPPPRVLPWAHRFASIVSKNREAIARGRSDYSMSRPSRRQRENMPLRPSSVRYLPAIGLVVDTSGSMGSLGSEVISTVTSVAKLGGKLIVYQADVGVQKKTKGAPKKYQGGGGTDLTAAIEQAAKECDVVVVITDGDTPWPSQLKTPVVAVVPHGVEVPSWIQSAPLDKK
jgi:predicted metal-dependent peptidase